MIQQHQFASDFNITIEPLDLKADIPSIIALNNENQRHYGLHSEVNAGQGDAEPEWDATQFMTEHFGGLTNNPNKMAKIVFHSNDNNDCRTLVSYIVFTPPKADLRGEEEKRADLEKEIAQFPAATNREMIMRLKTEDRMLSEELFGKGFEARYWELRTLATALGFQRKGLGSRLLEWGMAIVGHEIEKARKKGEVVEGCYLIASPMGERAYRKAGFVEVGRRTAEVAGGKGKYDHIWFVKKFSEP